MARDRAGRPAGEAKQRGSSRDPPGLQEQFTLMQGIEREILGRSAVSDRTGLLRKYKAHDFLFAMCPKQDSDSSSQDGGRRRRRARRRRSSSSSPSTSVSSSSGTSSSSSQTSSASSSSSGPSGDVQRRLAKVRGPKEFAVAYRDNDGREVVRYREVLTGDDHVFVLRGKLQSRDVVVKHYRSSKGDTRYEIDVLRHLRDMGCPLPWFSSGFRCWGERVLVMEKLEPLDETDDPVVVGRQVLRQLRYLHSFAAHSDIKPSNIMKRVTRAARGGVPLTEYFLIDYGGAATERVGHGWVRHTWTSTFTTQRHIRHYHQICNEWNDFAELGRTLRALQLWRQRGRHWRVHRRHLRGTYDGTLRSFMAQLHQWDAQAVPRDAHRTLRHILGGS